jgi:hypothetical protein
MPPLIPPRTFVYASQVPTNLQARYASTSTSAHAGAFPYPTQKQPTPYQIFHLSPGASQQDIKSRCTSSFSTTYWRDYGVDSSRSRTVDYDLVRAHHPDAPACRDVPPAERHARFQSISSAYDHLRGRRSSSSSGPFTSNAFEAELARRRRHSRGYAHAKRDWSFDFPGPGHNTRHGEGRAFDATDPAHKWKDRVLLFGGLAALAVGLYPMLLTPLMVHDTRHKAAVANLRHARQEAREHGHERRRAIKEKVAEDRAKRERDSNSGSEETQEV